MKTIVQTKAEIEKEFKSHNENMNRQIREQDALVKELTRKALQKVWEEAKRNVDNNKV
jgi:Skp family chaperone for outer membrane proteins